MQASQDIVESTETMGMALKGCYRGTAYEPLLSKVAEALKANEGL
jgi:hypothetical protein